MQSDPRPYATTVTTYGGDRVDVTPPAGGIATSTVTDAYGQAVEMRQYHGPAPTPWTAGSYDATRYTYTPSGALATTTDVAGHVWTNTYDISGRATVTSDPNKGVETTTYDAYGDALTRTDARGVTLAYTYDQLGRATGVYQSSVAPANQLVGYQYDAIATAKGQLTRTSVYDAGNAYTQTINAFDAAYQPTSETFAIPAIETGLAGSYTYAFTYAPDGSPATIRLPDVDGAAGLPGETITQDYTDLGQPSALRTNLPVATTLVSGIQYTGYGEVGVVTDQFNGGPTAYRSDSYEAGTRRLTGSVVTRSTTPTAVANLTYAYDPAGNVVSESDAVAGDHQCYAYDYLTRLNSAWTPASGDCTVAPALASLGGPAPYWQDLTLNATGDRTGEVDHLASTTTAYSYPAADSPQPHALQSTQTGATTDRYTYDAIGDTLTRPGQTLAWNSLGQLTSLTSGGATSSYLYGSEGTRLVERDATGKTLYLLDQELRYTTATGAKATTRYYTDAGATVAMRTAAGLTWLFDDHHGTAAVTVDATTQAVAVQRQTPFGAVRGGTGTWPAMLDRGFVGGSLDASGLIWLGVREYDPNTGRFVSADVVTDPSDPQQLDGYAYGRNAPTTTTDPDGRRPVGDDDPLSDTGGGSKAYNPNMPPAGQRDVAGVKINPTKFDSSLCAGPFVHCTWDQIYVHIVVRYAQEAGIDPRLAMDALIEENDRAWNNFGCPFGWSDTCGVGNMTSDTFSEAGDYYRKMTGKSFHGDYNDSKYDDDLSIQAMCWKLRQLSDELDEHAPAKFLGPAASRSRYQLIEMAYNNGDSYEIDYARDQLTPGERKNLAKMNGAMDKFADYWQRANNAVCEDFQYTCSPTAKPGGPPGHSPDVFPPAG